MTAAPPSKTAAVMTEASRRRPISDGQTEHAPIIVPGIRRSFHTFPVARRRAVRRADVVGPRRIVAGSR
jgi:hypothetical protein